MTIKHKNPQYNLRIADDLKTYLQLEAERHGISLNQEIINRLEATKRQDAFVRKQVVGGDDPDEFGFEQFGERVEKSFNRAVSTELAQIKADIAILGERLLDATTDSVVRIKSTGTTYGDRDRLKLYLDHVSDVRLVRLAVRDYDLGGGVMTVVMLGERRAAIMDTTSMTSQRPPREYEVVDFLRAVREHGLMDHTEFVTTRIEDTRDMDPRAAIDLVMAKPAIKLDGAFFTFAKLFVDAVDRDELPDDMFESFVSFLKQEAN